MEFSRQEDWLQESHSLACGPIPLSPKSMQAGGGLLKAIFLVIFYP